LDGASIFENVFVQEVGEVTNTRVLSGNTVIWKNTNRSSAYDVTPYDRTLVIDSDFLVFSNRLKHYLEADADFMICPSMHNLYSTQSDDSYLDPASIPMLWATNIIFNKTPEVKSIFNMVAHIKENWMYYSALYKFNFKRFRNDYAFSIACHMLGYRKLPAPVLFSDKDQLIQISSNGLTFWRSENNAFIKTQGQDVHLMNKLDLLDNYDSLMELAK
jgi:hypothetical protein